MSIVHLKNIQSNKLRMAYNNDVIRFYSNDATIPAAYADVAMTSSGSETENVRVRLYPAPDGTFYFNFRPYVTALINTRGFEDLLEPGIDGTDVSSFLYNSTNGTVLWQSVTIEIGTTTATYSLMWIAGAEQFGDHNTFTKEGYYVLTPLKKLTDNQVYLKYWQGYPFDISLYYGQNRIIFPYENIYTLKNETNLLSVQFSVDNSDEVNYTNRLVFSDGRTDETLESLLPLAEGYNKLRWTRGTSPTVSDKYIHLEKVPYKNGVYLKWLNRYGGYSYWLFEDTYSIDRSTKQLGELEHDNTNLEDAFGRTVSVGKESQDTIKIIAELLTEDERCIVEGIIDSPKIYLFTGEPLSRNSYRDWIEVMLKTSSSRIKNPKQPLTNFTFDIELPARYTQTL